MAKPPIGAKLKTQKHHTVIIQEELGSGGQGTVYRVRYNGRTKAMKWYHSKIFNTPEKLESFYENVSQNVENGSPSPQFLWPEDVTEIKNGSFGYIMDLRPARFHELSKLLVAKKVRFKNYGVRIDAMMNLVSAFRVLHNKGYAYQDLNDGNFFFDPNTGECLICDNDNALYQGNHTGILGKQRYMAPEIVLGQKMPDKNTDRFSMSVILFMMLVALHPLEGRYSTPPCMTAEFERRFYGEKPIFIFDPEDSSNRPKPILGGYATQLWNELPEYIRSAFCHSFSKASMTYDPVTGHYGKARMIEREWLNILSRFRNSVFVCRCGNEMIIKDIPAWCGRCSKEVPIWNRLQIKKYEVPLHPGVRIIRCQLGESADMEALDTVLTVHAQADQPNAYYITNDSQTSLKCITTKGQAVKLPPQGKMPVRPGIKGEAFGSPFEIK